MCVCMYTAYYCIILVYEFIFCKFVPIHLTLLYYFPVERVLNETDLPVYVFSGVLDLIVDTPGNIYVFFCFVIFHHHYFN